jgi:pimeloyl-ACP methyl ester carboxylesterase
VNKAKYLEANGSTLEYFESGAGSPVLLLHCTGGSSRQWSALAQRLASERRVVTANLYGYGGSSAWDGRAAFRLHHEAALIQELLRILGEPVDLVGHSYGGAVSLCVARAVPRKVKSLCVFEPASFHLLRTGDARDMQALHEITQVARAVWNALVSGEYVMGSQCFVDYWSGCGAWMSLGESPREKLLARLPKIGLDFQAAIHDPAPLDAFRELTMPRLVMSGEKTTTAATRICDALCEIWPDARRAVVSGAGHMGPVTHAGEVNDVISEFLRDPHLRRAS